MMKNASYFILKALFVLKNIYIFVLTFRSCRENGLIRKKSLISNLRRHNLVNKKLKYTYCPISHESKDNLKMKFGQLIEYNKRNIFLQKSCRK